MTEQGKTEATAKVTELNCIGCGNAKPGTLFVDGLCEDCTTDPTTLFECQKCLGTGQHQVGDSQHITSCNACDGEGYTLNNKV